MRFQRSFFEIHHFKYQRSSFLMQIHHVCSRIAYPLAGSSLLGSLVWKRTSVSSSLGLNGKTPAEDSTGVSILRVSCCELCTEIKQFFSWKIKILIIWNEAILMIGNEVILMIENEAIMMIENWPRRSPAFCWRSNLARGDQSHRWPWLVWLT